MENEKTGRVDSSSEKATEFASSRTYQTIQLLKRFNIIYWRNPNYKYGEGKANSTI